MLAWKRIEHPENRLVIKKSENPSPPTVPDDHARYPEQKSTAMPWTPTHPLERYLAQPWARWLLHLLCRERPGTARPHLERALISYADPTAPPRERWIYAPIHMLLDRMKGSLTREQLHAKLGGHPPTLRGILATARSIAALGLTRPQRWLHPLFVVWNFTNRCNLRCRHCYQESTNRPADDELSLAEKLRLVDQLGRQYVAMIAFAGGEPTLSPHLEPVLQRCRRYGIHTTIATHGGLLTPQRCARLAALGVRYVEVSLDSVDPDKHDRFRGVKGMWRQSVTGIKNVVATDGLRAGLAMCVTRENLGEVEAMLRLAVDLGVSCFAHFNFIPVGRAATMAEQDLTPTEREDLLRLLHRWMQTRKIGVISTAPQLGRVCLQHADKEGLIACSHAGNGPGGKARVVARYLGGCGAGRTYACIQPNGDVTPCVYLPGRILGNVRKRPFEHIFRDNPWWDLFCSRDRREGTCGVCGYRDYCGGCRARADAYYGRLDASDPGCLHNAPAWRELQRRKTTSRETEDIGTLTTEAT